MSVPPADLPERTRAVREGSLGASADSTHLERAASWLSLVCAVHCLVMPAALALLPVLGASSFALGDGLDHALTALVIVSAAAGAIWGYRRHHDIRFLVATALGLICYLAGHALEPLWYGVVAAVAGALMLATSSFLGARIGHAAVHPHHTNASCSH